MPQTARNLIRRLARDRAGVTALEWALIASTTVLALSFAAPGIFGALTNVYSTIYNALT